MAATTLPKRGRILNILRISLVFTNSPKTDIVEPGAGATYPVGPTYPGANLSQPAYGTQPATGNVSGAYNYTGASTGQPTQNYPQANGTQYPQYPSNQTGPQYTYPQPQAQGATYPPGAFLSGTGANYPSGPSQNGSYYGRQP